MSTKAISQPAAVNLQRLIDGETLNASAFTSKHLLTALLDDRIINQHITGKNRRKLHCSNPEGLRNHLRLKYGITDLKTYIVLKSQTGCDGEQSLLATTSTKSLRHRSLQGFFIKSFDPTLTLNHRSLQPLPSGAEYFIHDPTHLQLPASITIVGIENPECFIKIDRLRHLFPEECIFVMRYLSKSPVDWLKSIPNPYLHFGDFDPAGIAIYHHEFLKPLGEKRCRFFVPNEIGNLLKKGDPTLYDKQIHQLPFSTHFKQLDLQRLVEEIRRNGKGIEQEQLLLHHP